MHRHWQRVGKGRGEENERIDYVYTETLQETCRWQGDRDEKKMSGKEQQEKRAWKKKKII